MSSADGGGCGEDLGRPRPSLPEDTPFSQRVAALREGYSFGTRDLHPYKSWLKAQKSYLARYQRAGEHRPFPEKDGQPGLFPW